LAARTPATESTQISYFTLVSLSYGDRLPELASLWQTIRDGYPI
jgi:hypothetical protein